MIRRLSFSVIGFFPPSFPLLLSSLGLIFLAPRSLLLFPPADSVVSGRRLCSVARAPAATARAAGRRSFFIARFGFYGRVAVAFPLVSCFRFSDLLSVPVASRFSVDSVFVSRFPHFSFCRDAISGSAGQDIKKLTPQGVSFFFYGKVRIILRCSCIRSVRPLCSSNPIRCHTTKQVSRSCR